MRDPVWRKDRDGRPLGIVHRDVTPSNLLLAFDGGVKLIDFGIAKATRRVTETRTGMLKGKIAYMSPEQCQGELLDGRSDVFALGVVLYEASTGTRLFANENEYAVLRQIFDRDAPPQATLVAELDGGRRLTQALAISAVFVVCALIVAKALKATNPEQA